ncbi:MAG: CAP domain-containing protein [Gaiellales bacterium]
MGLESRDWYREDATTGKRRASRGRWVRAAITVAVLVVAAGVVSPTVQDKFGYTLPFGIGDQFRTTKQGSTTTIGLFPGSLKITLARESLYPPNDPWQPWLASESTCPRGEDAKAPPRIQAQVMVCLMNYARVRQGLKPLAVTTVLSSAAAAKAQDIDRCNVFEHAACGRSPDAVARERGYRGAFGENLLIAEGPLTAPRVAMDGWLNSPGHRENLFRPEWTTAGIALLPGTNVGRFDDATVWVMHFGDR